MALAISRRHSLLLGAGTGLALASLSNRALFAAEAPDIKDEDIFQLSLTFKFPPTESLRQLGDGNRWCQSPEEIKDFRAFIYGSLAFKAVGQDAPTEVRLEYGVAG